MRTPFFLVVIVLLLSILIDWGIWRMLKNRATRRSSGIYLISSIICWIVFIIVILFPKRSEDNDILPVMWILYYYVAVYIAKCIVLLFNMIGKIPTLWKGKNLNLGLWCGIPLGILVIIASVWGAMITRRQIEIKEVTIFSDKIPREFNGYKIVQFSDAHVGTWGNDTTFIVSLIDTINSTHPDLIVFTGDIVNRKSSELKPFINVLKKLSAKDGVISILGNHDYGDYINWNSNSEKQINLQDLKNMQKEMGWKLLNNETISLKRGESEIQIIGVENWGEPPFKQYGNLEKAYPTDSLHNLNDKYFKILLSHNPEHWNQVVSKTSNINLTLSGHTHAMQCMLKFGNMEWSPAKYRYEQWGGLYERISPDGTPNKLYVNIGAGEVGIPARIGATPEVTLITLRR